jgi:hypothetical protein
MRVSDEAVGWHSIHAVPGTTIRWTGLGPLMMRLNCRSDVPKLVQIDVLCFIGSSTEYRSETQNT